MRVLALVTNDEAPFFQQQVETLAELGVECDVCTPEGGPGDRSLGAYLRLAGEVIRRSTGGYDLVHANYGLMGPFAVAQVRLPVVLSLWGSDLFGRYHRVSRVSARLADEVIVMTPEMADAVPGSPTVIPHGPALDRFRPMSRPDARDAVGWEPDESHVLFPYEADRPVKNFPLAKRVVEKAGRQLGRPVRLHTIGDVPHERMPTYLNAAEVVLLTSHTEGSPNSVKEAMACNVPVVARDVGDVRTRLDGVVPSVVGTTESELVDGLVAVLQTPCRSNGRAEVEPVSARRCSERIKRVYERALNADAQPTDARRTGPSAPSRTGAATDD